MEVILTMLLPGALFFGVLSALIGARKGEPVLGFFAGFFFGPLGMLFAIFSKGNRVNCPHCMTAKDPRALICPSCGRDHYEEVGKRSKRRR